MDQAEMNVQGTITREASYPHPIARVWAAISEGEEISKWFIQADFRPEVGYRYTFTHEETVIKGKVLEVLPPTQLVYTWMIEGTGVETTVHWTLTEADGGTQLMLEHTGIDAYGDSAADFFNNYSGGWDKTIAELRTFLSAD